MRGVGQEIRRSHQKKQRHYIIIASIIILLISWSPPSLHESKNHKTNVFNSGSQVDDEIEALFRDSLIIDGLLNYSIKVDPDCLKDCALQNIDLGLIKGLTGVDVGSLTIPRPFEKLVAIHDYVTQDQREGGLIIKTFNDLDKSKKAKKYGVLFYAQQHTKLDGSAAPIRKWFNSGLRIVQIHYSSQDNQAQSRLEKLGGGSDESHQGLTELGRKAVQHFNRLNMIIDLSHCSEKTTMDVIQISCDPVIANHANAWTLTPDARNKSDGELLAIAQSGGVIGVTPIGWMIDRDGDGKGNIDDYCTHIDYITNLLGIDHVGIASDSVIDGWGPNDRHYSDVFLANPERWKIVAKKLQDEFGYTWEHLRKIFGLNFKRVYEQILPGLTRPVLLTPQNHALIPPHAAEFYWEDSEYRGIENLTKKKTPAYRLNLVDFGMIAEPTGIIDPIRENPTIQSYTLPDIGPVTYDIIIERKDGSQYTLEYATTNLVESTVVFPRLTEGSEFRWQVTAHISIGVEITKSDSGWRYFETEK